MQNFIYCKRVGEQTQVFYLSFGETQYYLFNQNFKMGVNRYYQHGVSVGEAINFAKSNLDNAIVRTMRKLPIYIKYIESEYSIVVLDKTEKKIAKRSKIGQPYNRAKLSQDFDIEFSNIGA